MVKHFMDELDLFDLLKKYVPVTDDCLADNAESLCISTANIICDNRQLYKVREWLTKYYDSLIMYQWRRTFSMLTDLEEAFPLFYADVHSFNDRLVK